ncbi:Uncharacterized protein SCF082_LOCUS17516 [Durusdinium trenchii]
MHLMRLVESFYCHSMRTSQMVELFCPLALGAGGAVAALRLAYGHAYFKQWTDEESMNELKKLYSLRTVGTKFVLRCWRMRRSTVFCFQVVVMMWLRYTVDLWMDIEAMKIFLQEHQPWFFTLNLLGVFLGLLWTAYEFYNVITSPGSKITNTEIFFAGLTLPLLGQHVTYLAILSLFRGSLHPFLFVSTLAEAILESSISSFIQTYAVVFTSRLTWDQKAQLYFSVFSSFVSIGYAFSTIDMFQGGRMLVKVPGFCKSFNARFGVVFFFRVAEITSRATSLALFQTVTRPYGMFVVIAADGVIMSIFTIFYQCRVGQFAPVERFAFVRQNFFYVIPSVLFCRMAPILEKDTVITIPPIIYYTIRYLELAGMVAVAGEWMEWDKDYARDLFEDDGLILAAFALSTVMMLVLGIIIRSFLSVRTLMDTSGEIWSEHEFNSAQHALKNRILEDHPADLKAIKIVSKLLESDLKMTGSQCHSFAREAGFPPAAHWDSNFLRAKVALIIKEALLAVEGFDFSNARSRHRTLLNSGSLVSIRSTGRSLTSKGDRIVGHMSNDLANQKFVLECDEGLLISGNKMRLRALTSGELLGLVKTDPLNYELRLQPTWSEEAATFFSPLLVHEEIYRSASRFAQFVHMGSGLEVVELRVSKRRGQSLKDWDSSGWRIFAINGKTPSREEVDEILQKGKGSKMVKAQSSVSDPHSDSNMDLWKSLRPGVEAAARGEYIVQFVRRDASDTPIMAGSKVLLQHAGGWTNTPMGMSESVTSDVDDAAEAPEEQDRFMPRIVEGEGGLTFTMETAEFGSKDDPSIYQWAANLIGDLADTVQLQESFAEKYRTLTVVTFNARSTGMAGVKGILQADPDLHLRVLSNLLQPIRQEKDIRVEYLLSEVLMDLEFDFDNENPGEPMTITAFEDDDDGSAMALQNCGVQVGDQLLLIELMEEDGSMKKISGFVEIRDLLMEAEEEDVDTTGFLTFRCKGRSTHVEETNETVKKAVAQSLIIAELLPTWTELQQAAHKSVERQQVCDMKEGLLSHGLLFRTKCDLVQALISTGFALHHDDFASKALQLHKRFDPATDEVLWKFFSGRDNAELRDEILIVQLDVLTNTWRSLPQIIKEDIPDVVRTLFHPDVEITLIHDAARVLMQRWESVRESEGEMDSLKMPDQLVRFFKYMRPASDDSAGHREFSMHWIVNAWQADRIQQRKVQALLSDIARLFESAETFWERRVKDAHARAEEAKKLLEQAVRQEVIRVVLCSSIEDLEKVKGMLTDDLMLKQDCKIGDSENVPKGKCLVWSQGIVMEKFKTFKTPSPDLAKIRRELTRLYEGKDVRLLFSGLDFDRQHDESQKALDSLQKYIVMAKTAGEAFPSIKQILDDLSDVLHKSQLFKKDQEAKRKVILKEKELQATMKVAERRLQQVEKEKEDIEAKNRKLHEEKGKLEADTKAVRDELAKVMHDVAAEQSTLKRRVQELEVEKKELKDALRTVEGFLKDKRSVSSSPGGAGEDAAKLEKLIQLVERSVK